LMSLTGDPDGPAYRAGISVFDVMAGLHATIGILAALNRRHETAAGQRIEVNLLSSALSGLVNHTSAVVASDVTPFRMGNAHPSLFPYEPLPTADGEIIVIAGNDGQFVKLCEVLGIADVAEDERFGSNEDRTARRDELTPLLLDALGKRTTEAWFELFQANGLPGGPVNTVREGVAFAESIGLHPVVEVGEGDAAVPSIRNPITLSDSPTTYRYPPPTLGEHTDELRAWLRTARD
jgi:crotonobetainyl-CoA:carnitine CoA-transferase CaiB-like acyl-CoA transferase